MVGFNRSHIKTGLKHLVLMNSIAVRSVLGRAVGAEDKVRDICYGSPDGGEMESPAEVMVICPDL